jgi:hypothetical protein
MKNEDKYFEMVRQASENVSKYIIQWGKRNNEDRWGEHEATWKALLFHELILIDEKVKDNLSMENTPITEDRKTKGKRFDLWLEDLKNSTDYLLEVKFIHYKERKRGYGITMLNSKAGIYGDLLKLDRYLTSHRKPDLKGISIAVNEEDDKVDVSKIIKKIDKELLKLLNNNLRLLICSNGKCEFAPANEY